MLACCLIDMSAEKVFGNEIGESITDIPSMTCIYVSEILYLAIY